MTSLQPPIQLPPRTGVMLCGHGSRNRHAVHEFAELADRLRARLPDVPVAHGYLEFADPVLHEGLESLRIKGVERILAVPGMLFAAGHAKNDIPSVLNGYAAGHPGLRVDYGRELGVDLKLLRAAGARIEEAEDAVGATVPRHDTLLMVVGRGASDPDANSNVAKVMRLLWEGMGYGWGETAFSGVTFPLVGAALEHAARLGYRRVIVFPYFLFTGVLVKRIYAAVDAAAARHPGIDFVKASYLGAHELVVEVFIERIIEILDGVNVMNCQMCKYREQVIGFEAEVGLAQASHHHHVEGVGGGLEGCPCGGDCDASCRDEAFCAAHGLPFTPLHDHAHHHHHDDDHHHHHHGHHPYPHADHPLGPVTLPTVPGARARKLRQG